MTIESGLFESWNTKVMLLLGAGASKPLGMPLMREFHDLVVRRLDEEQKELMRDISLVHMKETNEVTPDLEALLTIIERYRYFYDILFGDERFGYSVEKVTEDMNELDNAILYYTEPSSKPYPSSSYLITAFHRKEILKNLDASLRDLMFEEYGKNLNNQVLDKLYSPLLEVMREHSSQGFIPVFTTNYDMAVETYAQQAGLNIETGFQPTATGGSIWKPGRFYQLQSNEQKMDLLLFKLHGSLAYHRKGDDIISTSLAIRDPGDYQSALVYPTQTKEYPDEEPFRTAYEFLKGCLATVKVAVIIGYSFRDPSIHRILLDSLELNPDLFFILICGTNLSHWKKFAQQNLKNYQIIPHYFEFASPDGSYLGEFKKAMARDYER